MRYCGGDDVFCPPFTVAPINVHSGFYTADYLYEECPPGQWRNLTILPRSADPTDHSPIVTQQPLPLCQLCPNGTYKSIAGDHLSQCKACQPIISVSSPDHITCDCLIAWPEGYTSQFNITTGKCQKYRTSDIPLIDASMWLTNTSLTRHRQLPCDAGHYCQGGLRFKCPPGRYGALTQETRPLCEGVCTQGFYCLESSTSPTSYPCGGAKWICPEGSHTPLLVPPGWYSNEDVPELLRYSSKICPKGYFCPGDGKRYACSKGTYTDQEGTVDAACMGPCDRGKKVHCAPVLLCCVLMSEYFIFFVLQATTATRPRRSARSTSAVIPPCTARAAAPSPLSSSRDFTACSRAPTRARRATGAPTTPPTAWKCPASRATSVTRESRRLVRRERSAGGTV